MDLEEGRGRPQPESDSGLMAEFYGCSEAAFERLADRWWPRLFAFFRKLGFGNEDAEDLVMDSLVRLFTTKERQQFDTSQELAPFLFTIARRLAVGAWRKRAAGRDVPWDEDLPLVTGAREPESELEADLLACVWQLPEAELTYVVLCGKHGLGELSHNEIAEMLDKWPPQITHLSKRALAALKECMHGKGYR
jgi:RNA polymerase sigma factor (sigma-70 family)